MVYKKYIKKNGKIYGPYVYHSRRINGKVVSEYRGVESKKNQKKFFPVLIISLILISIISFLFFFSPKLSGQAIFNVVGTFQEKNLSDGKLNLVLKEGELIPSNSKILIENNKNTYEYNLSDLLPNEKVSKGEFNLKEGDISGFGEGYGLIGTKIEYPIINFEIELYDENKTLQKEKNISINNTLNPKEDSLPSNENKQKKNETQNINNKTLKINETENETLINNIKNESNNKSENKIETENKTKINLPNLKTENQSNQKNSPSKNFSEKNSQEKTPSEIEPQKENTTNEKTEQKNKGTIPLANKKSQKPKGNSPEEKVKETTETTNEKSKTTTSNENNKEKGTTEPSQNSQTPKIKDTSPKKTEQPSLTGNIISNLFDSLSKAFVGLLTGQVTGEPEKISGEVSKEKNFEYQLNGKKAKIIPRSVKSNGEKISENLLSLSEENGKLIVKTNYTIEKKGFGKNYGGENTKTFSIDLNKLNETLVEGDLKITLIYNDKKIISLEERISNETIKNKEENNSIEEIKNQLFNQTINESLKIPESINFSTNLTEEEKNILKLRLNESSINTIVRKYRDKFLVEFEFAGYKTEHSYSGNLSNKELIKKIERDKYLWIKDILKNLLTKKNPIEKIVNLSQNYPI